MGEIGVMPAALARLFSPGLIALYAFVASGVYIHLRGRTRHKFLRQLTDHSTVTAPYNALAYLFSAVPSTPYLDVKLFPQLATLRENWQVIREEAQALFNSGQIRRSDEYDDLAFNSFFKTGWKRFYLKWYDEPLPSAVSLCPRTVELVKNLPGINAAMFTVLAPKSKLGRHRDPFAGSLRYHLGIVTPNSDACRIIVDGETYSWRDGQDVMFDETYLHEARNDTDVSRIILFCDVERPLKTPIMRGLNRFICKHVMRHAGTKNVTGEKVGFLNRIYKYAYAVRRVGKRLKSANRPIYYVVKYALFAAILWAVFF